MPEEKEKNLIISAEDYQNFAKAKSGTFTEVIADPSIYQNFKYKKMNISKAELAASRKAAAELKKLKKAALEAVADIANDISSERAEVVVKAETDSDKKKALSLVEQIKNPTGKGSVDNQLRTKKVGNKTQYYFDVGNHEIPFIPSVEFVTAYDDDPSGPQYTSLKEQIIREYEQEQKEKFWKSITSQQENNEKFWNEISTNEQKKKAAESSIKD